MSPFIKFVESRVVASAVVYKYVVVNIRFYVSYKLAAVNNSQTYISNLHVSRIIIPPPVTDARTERHAKLITRQELTFIIQLDVIVDEYKKKKKTLRTIILSSSSKRAYCSNVNCDFYRRGQSKRKKNHNPSHSTVRNTLSIKSIRFFGRTFSKFLR